MLIIFFHINKTLHVLPIPSKKGCILRKTSTNVFGLIFPKLKVSISPNNAGSML